ncbi:hypothetical protein POSPLADRAFT_1070122 [Postia placenta MAD-698-R-SB12]|uniref:Hemerythrin-like domain-containing protein n=1 Tax=Postia placenta MAD-698-R-SB12 TaxID=670580 RepID=A0A1X6N052_9APHY|nr:hypothetical protein POSPLADRAFT_1070122 [Postia placenta MAD-698-R-SB12]OSX61985.1 hypothetical protein POSPLADRAFT_1070122 [Postia placenta MAD-698-R-SB12]
MSQKTLFQAVKEDHEEMYLYHDEFKRARAAGDVDAQARWARQLTWEVARHAVGEELVVYPLMEKHLGAQGRALADHDRAEHQHVKEHLYKLESLQPGAADYSALIEQIMATLHPHNDDEEVKDLPLLEAAIGTDASRSAAASFKRTKKLVPTRAHPSAPNKPPFETLAGLLAAPVDKLKDWFAEFPKEEEMGAAKEELTHRDHDAAADRERKGEL